MSISFFELNLCFGVGEIESPPNVPKTLTLPLGYTPFKY